MVKETQCVELVEIKVFRKCCPKCCSYCGFEYESCGIVDNTQPEALTDYAIKRTKCVCCGMPYSSSIEILNKLG